MLRASMHCSSSESEQSFVHFGLDRPVAQTLYGKGYFLCTKFATFGRSGSVTRLVPDNNKCGRVSGFIFPEQLV